MRTGPVFFSLHARQFNRSMLYLCRGARVRRNSRDCLFRAVGTLVPRRKIRGHAEGWARIAFLIRPGVHSARLLTQEFLRPCVPRCRYSCSAGAKAQICCRVLFPLCQEDFVCLPSTEKFPQPCVLRRRYPCSAAENKGCGQRDGRGSLCALPGRHLQGPGFIGIPLNVKKKASTP